MKRFFIALASFFALVSCGDDKEIIDYTAKDPDPSEEEQPSTPTDRSNLYGTLPILHTDGRWLCNESGKHVNLHGFWQTYTPWFNGDAWGEHNWGGLDYEGCVSYNKRIIDEIIASGIKVDFMRLHMDTYWFIENRPQGAGAQDYFKESRMKDYFEKVYLPIIKHCISKGLYVVLRPYPCGESGSDELKYGDGFFKMLETMWRYFSSHRDIRNNADVMFELMNEPVSIDASAYGGNRDKAVSAYMQHFIDLIRANCQNIIWVPGLTWQQYYQCYVNVPLKGDNLGFAVHCYPGWYGSDAIESTGENGGNMGQGMTGGYTSFQKGWNNSIAAAAELHPIMITEMDWAPKKYDKTWGKSITGLAGATGFGANFKYIMDKCGNVSYMTFTAPNDLALYPKMVEESSTNYWNDPEACPWQIYRWFEEYHNGRIQPESADELIIGSNNGKIELTKGGSAYLIVNAIKDQAVFPLQSDFELSSSNTSIVRVSGNDIYADAKGEVTITAKALGLETSIVVSVAGPTPASDLFPVTADKFDVNIWETGTLDVNTKTFTTGQYGFAGWKFDNLDISMHKYLVVKLGDNTDFSGQPSFRLFDSNNYWGKPAMYNFNNEKTLRIEIANMKNEDGGKVNPKTICIVGFWTLGGKTVQIDDIYFED